MRSGLVSSLANPGGNVTGLSLQAANLAGKRLEILRELIPQLRRLAIIFNGGNEQTVLEMGDTKAAAGELKIDVALLEIRRMQDIAPVFEKLNSEADALYVVVDQLVVANFNRILTFALSTRLPMIYSTRDFVRSGGLMSYGPSYVDLFGVRVSTCIGFCRAGSRAIYRSNSRRGSNWFSISRRQERSACVSLSRSCCA